jgi:divalent metal cation (Fe/Co/Zn/Cd) transporter
MRELGGSQGPTARSHDLRTAVRLSILTIAWNVLAGAAAILIAAATGSLSLAGFGFSAALDSIASAALIWRFGAEAKDSSHGHRLETVTVRIVGSTLIGVAVYVATQSARSLWSHSGSDAASLAVLVVGLSVLVLPPLALAKLRLAARLGSKALKGDGMLTAIGATLAALTMLGLVLDALFGWWWSDAGAALIMSGLLVREGVLALRQTE